MSAKRWFRFLAGVLALFFAGFATAYVAFPGILLDAYRRWQRSDAGFERRITQVKEWNVPYLDSARQSEKPVVLFLHGFGDTKDNFIDLAAGLTGDYRVLAPDLPGFGETAIRANADYNPALYVNTILGLLDQLDIRSVHLVGYSMGGALAVEVAADASRRVRSLTLLAPAGVRGDRLSDLDKMVDAGDPSPLVYRDRESFERVLRLNFNGLPKIPEFALRATLAKGKRRAEVWESVFATMLDELETTDLEEKITSLQMPVLLITGAEDRIVDRSAARRWRAINPDIEVVILPDASHALTHQQSETITRLLSVFLNEE